MSKSIIKLKPPISWMGSKRRMIKHILPLIPEFTGTYYEPFIGAGSIFLELKPKKAIISDINPAIINMWIQIKRNPTRLINSLIKHKINKEYWNQRNSEFPKIKQNTIKRASYS